RHGGAHGEEFLGDGEALEVGPPLPAVLDRDRHADPAALGETPGEALVPPGQPRVDPAGERAGREHGGDEIADLLTEPSYPGRLQRRGWGEGADHLFSCRGAVRGGDGRGRPWPHGACTIAPFYTIRNQANNYGTT